jgi:hypothetical protein
MVTPFGVAVGVGVGLEVDVGVGVNVDVDVGVGVGLGVAVDVEVGVGVGVGLGLPTVSTAVLVTGDPFGCCVPLMWYRPGAVPVGMVKVCTRVTRLPPLQPWDMVPRFVALPVLSTRSTLTEIEVAPYGHRKLAPVTLTVPPGDTLLGVKVIDGD